MNITDCFVLHNNKTTRLFNWTTFSFQFHFIKPASSEIGRKTADVGTQLQADAKTKLKETNFKLH